MNILTVVALFSAISGVLGITLSVVERRSREIGIRKILGASIWQLQLTQNKSLIWGLIIAFFIGIPISYYSIRARNTEFVYRVDILPWMFMVGMVAITLCTLLTSGVLTMNLAYKTQL